MFVVISSQSSLNHDNETVSIVHLHHFVAVVLHLNSFSHPILLYLQKRTHLRTVISNVTLQKCSDPLL